MENRYQYKVAIQCMTFNHAKYIEEALRGFAMQQTVFPVVYIIVDDASTDGEQFLLKEWAADNLDTGGRSSLWIDKSYGKLIEAPYKRNSLLNFVIILLSDNHYQRGLSRKKRDYIAEWFTNAQYQMTSEGDDYWISANKLQKQVDFLDNHPQYALCHHNIFYENNGKRILRDSFDIPQSQTIEELARKNYIQTAAALYRNPGYELIPDTFQGKVYAHFIYMRICEKGDVYYMDEPMSVYRLHDGGIFSKKSLFEQFKMTADNISAMVAFYYDKNTQVTQALQDRLKVIYYDYLRASVKKLDMSSICKVIKYYKHCKAKK